MLTADNLECARRASWARSREMFELASKSRQSVCCFWDTSEEHCKQIDCHVFAVYPHCTVSLWRWRWWWCGLMKQLVI